MPRILCFKHNSQHYLKVQINDLYNLKVEFFSMYFRCLHVTFISKEQNTALKYLIIGLQSWHSKKRLLKCNYHTFFFHI